MADITVGEFNYQHHMLDNLALVDKPVPIHLNVVYETHQIDCESSHAHGQYLRPCDTYFSRLGNRVWNRCLSLSLRAKKDSKLCRLM